MRNITGKTRIWFFILLFVSIFLLYVGASILSEGGLNPELDKYIAFALMGVGFVTSVICYAIYIKHNQTAKTKSICKDNTGASSENNNT